MPNVNTQFKKGVSISPETQFKKGENMGVNHPRWKGGKERFKCIDCNNACSFYSKRCRKCSNLIQSKGANNYFYGKKGEQAPNWQGGVTPYYKIMRANKLKEAGGSHSFKEWETLKAQYNWTCPCCKKQEPEIKLTKDHIISVNKGGSDNIENIQPLCVSCNSKKSIKTIRYELVNK